MVDDPHADDTHAESQHAKDQSAAVSKEIRQVKNESQLDNEPQFASETQPPINPKIDSKPFIEASANAKSRYGRFNLAIIGGTGVGKSSLVNAVFGRDLAKVGKGLPVTSGINYHHDQSLGIWDFEGFEIGTHTSPGDTLRDHLRTIATGPKERQISVVWYCVLANADRLTSVDINMIRELHEAGLPVMLVLTKVHWTKNPLTGKRKAPKDVEEFRIWLENPVDENGNSIYLPIQRVLLTSSLDKNRKGKGHGLGELVAETLALSPADEKDAFRIAQRLNLTLKREMARPVIMTASSAAAATAAIPIPVADAVALAPIQLGMMAHIGTIYDIEMKTMLSVSTIGQLGAQITGQALARSFIKLIPGAGSAINAVVASALTAAVGEAWLRLCEQIHTGKVDLAKASKVWSEYSPSLVSVIMKTVEGRKKK